MPAELLSYYYTNPDTKVKLQFQIILQCAPLLKGIKVSNIMTMATSSCGYLTELLAGTGITYRILYCSKGRSLVLFYRKRALMEHLKKEQVHLFLREYGYEDEELDEYMPNVDNIQEFKEIMEPKRVYILDVENDGMAYLGFHFICSWDEDHDYGVMMHKERVVKMGGGDVAFLSWIAEEDKKASEIV